MSVLDKRGHQSLQRMLDLGLIGEGPMKRAVSKKVHDVGVPTALTSSQQTCAESVGTEMSHDACLWIQLHQLSEHAAVFLLAVILRTGCCGKDRSCPVV